jgi:hypothetical protein
MHPDHSPTEAPLHTAAIAGSADQLHVVIGTEDGQPLPAEAVAAGLTVQITPPGDLNFWNCKESRLRSKLPSMPGVTWPLCFPSRWQQVRRPRDRR